MSDLRNHDVVPFAMFVERRERRNRIAATLRERGRSDVSVETPSAAAVPITFATDQATSAETVESGKGANESPTIYTTEALRAELPKRAPRCMVPDV